MKKAMSLLCSLLMSLTLCAPAFAVGTGGVITEAHIYPILPGSEEWETMTPHQRLAASSVSRQEVERMTTDALVETVLNYPYLVDMYAYNTIELGIEQVSRYFPGLSELFSRPDAITSLQDYAFAERMRSGNGDANLNIYGVQVLREHIEKLQR